MAGQEPDETLKTLWLTIQGELEASLADSEDGPFHDTKTIRRKTYDERFREVSIELPIIQVEENQEVVDSSVELSIGPSIAQGGMGIIYKAKQKALQRDVVVKMVLPEKNNKRMRGRLLQEAWMMGSLEHPNIVPVYQLGRDSQERPMLVMKRVEGVLWKDLLHNRVPKPFFLQDTELSLDWHINILLSVCNAIEFSHSKGVLHRDVKPSNVMIGPFGEVYLLDWGIAIRLEEDKGNVLLPLAKDSSGIVGTPAYMAPEMTLGKGHLLDYSTDVYLLGSVLFEILSGQPPHRKNTLAEALYSAYSSKPAQFGSHVPQEFGDICKTAMHVKQEERYPTVKSFRQALLFALEHRESHKLCLQMNQLYNEFEKHIQQELETSDTRLDLAYDLFTRCHFGFQRALEIWPQNQDAIDGLQRLLEKMIEYELHFGDYKASMRWLADLPRARKDLEQRIVQLRLRVAQEESHIERLREIALETDLSQSLKFRTMAALALGLVWGLATLIGYFLEAKKIIYLDHGWFLVMNGLFAVFLCITSYVGRKALFNNRANRQLVQFIFWVLATFVLFRLSVMAMGMDFRKTAILEYAIFIHFVGVMAIWYDLRIFWAAFVYIVIMILSMLYPQHFMALTIIAHPAGTTIVAWFWVNHTQRDDEARLKRQQTQPLHSISIRRSL